METQQSDIPLDYITVKTTHSRIDRDLLAIPVSLLDLFPKKSGMIYLVRNDGVMQKHRFTARDSSTRECRIYGLRQFYSDYQIQDGDELVIQKFDNDKYRLLPESVFRQEIQKTLTLFENSLDDDSAQKHLKVTEEIANMNAEQILKNVFVKLADVEHISKRTQVKIQNVTKRESVPPALRRILQAVYDSKCQITGFSFLKRDGHPYFEIHHIDPEFGNHLKNLLVVSPNVHAQFTHANVQQSFDNQGWLRAVKFNEEDYTVFQRIDDLQRTFQKEIHFS